MPYVKAPQGVSPPAPPAELSCSNLIWFTWGQICAAINGWSCCRYFAVIQLLKHYNCYLHFFIPHYTYDAYSVSLLRPIRAGALLGCRVLRPLNPIIGCKASDRAKLWGGVMEVVVLGGTPRQRNRWVFSSALTSCRLLWVALESRPCHVRGRGYGSVQHWQLRRGQRSNAPTLALPPTPLCLCREWYDPCCLGESQLCFISAAHCLTGFQPEWALLPANDFTGFQPQGGSASLFLRYFPSLPFFFFFFFLPFLYGGDGLLVRICAVRPGLTVQVISPFSCLLWWNMMVDEVGEPATNFIQETCQV